MKKIFSAALALVCVWFATPALAALPSGYTQLEYIESTGTQWIDTGVYVNTLTNPTIETSFKMNKKNDIDWFGTQGISQPTILYNFDSDKNVTYIRWGSTASVEFRYESGKRSNYFLFNSNFSKLKIDNNNNQPKYYVNDELIATQTSTPSFRNNQPLLIGRARTPSNSSWKSFKISDNGVDLFYGVPCTRDSDNVAGMYDLVSNQFFTNAGTGEFIAGPVAKITIATTKYNETAFGPLNTALQNAISVVDSVVSNTINQAGDIAKLQTQKQTRPADDTCPAYKQCLLVEDENGKPHWYEITDPFRDFVTPIIANNVAPASTTNDAGYTQLEYIQSTGTQWIDTGIVAQSGISSEIKLLIKNTMVSGCALGAVPGNQFHATFWFNGKWDSVVGGDKVTSAVQYNTPLVATFKSDTDGYKFYVDGVLTNYGSTVNTTGSLNLFLFKRNGTGSQFPMYGNMYYAKIWENDTLVRDFVPVKRNSDGAVGMYDTVSKTFFENKGTGTFTAGPNVANTDVPANGTWSWTWTANASNGINAGTVYGEGFCNTVSGTAGTPATSTQISSAAWSTNGKECWCRMIGLDDGDGEIDAPDNSVWVKAFVASDAATCDKDCSENCVYYGNNNSTFRKTVLGM